LIVTLAGVNEASLQRQPSACIWCRTTDPAADYNLSHVIPASCGNEELVLPPPIVCSRCNGNFTKIEQAFAREPEFNFKAALLGVPNARTGKPFTHDRFGISEKLPPRASGESRSFTANINLNLHGLTQIEVVPNVTLNGVELSLPPVADPVTPRWLGLYTRAVYKILFEWYAHHYYVTGRIPSNHAEPTDEPFENICRFVKAQRYRGPRLILRTHETIDDAMDYEINLDSNLMLTRMNLLGTHYVGALVGDNATIEVELSRIAQQAALPTLALGSTLRAYGTESGPRTTEWTPA
jgi:hypothetical protein